MLTRQYFFIFTEAIVFSSISKLNYRLFSVLLISSFIPTLYSTARIYFLGSLPEPWSFSIAAQVAWLNVTYEVLNEALLLPLAYILGAVISDKKKFAERMTISLLIFLIFYVVVTTGVLLFTGELTSGMKQTVELYQKTVIYIRLESLAILISSTYAFCCLVLVLKNKHRVMYTLLVVRTLFTLLFDSMFVSQLPFSMQLGVNGVAYTNILVNSILLCLSVYWLVRYGFSLNKLLHAQFDWVKEWFQIGLKSGLESFVRNVAFIVMILQLVNEVKQSGVFWVTNQFIWGWLLLPVLALGQLIRQDAACSKGLSSESIKAYFSMTSIFVLLWLITIPLWKDFLQHFMGIKEYEKIFNLTILMLGFYIIFAFNNVIDSYFYGIGRTDLMLYQSLIVNIVYYGGAFILFKNNWFIPNLNSIAIMFGVGITVDALVTFLLYRHHRQNDGLHVHQKAISLQVQ